MRKTAIFLLAALSLGMGRNSPTVPPAGAPAPEPYQDRFKSTGATFGAVFTHPRVSFSFTSFFGSTIGMCRYGGGSASVQLSSSAWARGSETFREMLVYHELGHCMLGRGHRNTRLSSGNPESLMNSVLFNERTYAANRDYYLRELFTAEVNRTVDYRDPGVFDGCEFGH